MIVNPQPYARKIETGGMKVSVPTGIVEAARVATRRQYPNLAVDARFVNIPSGLLPPAPWVLRTDARHKGKRVRPDRRAGQPVTYPALIMSER